MTTIDKAKNTSQQAKGKLKETAGKLSGNDKLRAEGKADRTKGDLKQVGEKLKDAFSK
ncbi:MAG: CsbD family protein [Actinomycetota bacterium]|nr:CsbD family protein [Actinomycetota bacterium]